jgi:hypothetical protein
LFAVWTPLTRAYLTLPKTCSGCACALTSVSLKFVFALLWQLLLIPRSSKRTFGDFEFRAWAEEALRTQGVVSTLADVSFNARMKNDEK